MIVEKQGNLKKDEYRYSILSYLLVFFCFCPFVSIVPLPSVTQPVAFAFGLLFIFLSRDRLIDKKILLAAIPLCIVFVMSIKDITKITVWRSLIGYFSFFIFCISGYLLSKKKGGVELFLKVIMHVSIVWLLFALIQFTIGYDILLRFKKLNFDITENRGLTSLATEPSYYGAICFFLLFSLEIFNLKFQITNMARFRTLILFQVVFLAQSTITILYLMLFYALKLGFKKSNRVYVIIFVSVLFVIGIFSNLYLSTYSGSSRLIRLINLLFEEPRMIYLLDESINHRLNHIIFSVQLSLENWFIPLDILAWKTEYHRMVMDNLSWVIWAPPADRIMSGFGGLIFETGVFSVSVFYLLYNTFVRSINTVDKWPFLLTILIVMFSAIPLAFPPFGLLIGLLLGFGKRY